MDLSHEARGKAAKEAYGRKPAPSRGIQDLIAEVFRRHPVAGIEQSLALGKAVTGSRDAWLAEIARQRAAPHA